MDRYIEKIKYIAGVDPYLMPEKNNFVEKNVNYHQ